MTNCLFVFPFPAGNLCSVSAVKADASSVPLPEALRTVSAGRRS